MNTTGIKILPDNTLIKCMLITVTLMFGACAEQVDKVFPGDEWTVSSPEEQGGDPEEPYFSPGTALNNKT